MSGLGRRMVMGAAALAGLAGGAVATQGADLLALSRLEPGEYQLRVIGEAGARPQSICVADPDVLLQLKHRGAPCSRVVIDNGPSGATVHYTCPANGYGRTSLRVETPRLAKIDTQGLYENAPFAYRAEARRVGPCPMASAHPNGR